MIAFVVWENIATYPMVPARLFANKVMICKRPLTVEDFHSIVHPIRCLWSQLLVRGSILAAPGSATIRVQRCQVRPPYVRLRVDRRDGVIQLGNKCLPQSYPRALDFLRFHDDSGYRFLGCLDPQHRLFGPRAVVLGRVRKRWTHLTPGYCHDLCLS
jgi:hypothetical protein